jgi:hypothetical protein
MEFSASYLPDLMKWNSSSIIFKGMQLSCIPLSGVNPRKLTTLTSNH